MAKVQIASAIASAHGITLYLADGSVQNLANNDWKTKAILDEVLGPLARKETVFIDLDDYSIEKKVEKKSGGLIRFFKRTVSAVASAIGASHNGGAVREDAFPILPNEVPALLPKGETVVPKPIQQLTEKLDANLNSPGELVAVVKDKDGKDQVVKGVAKLSKQIDWAAKTGNTVGLQRFLERIATVKHEHTVDELLTFMEKGDLPIADDGSIVAYKVLTSSSYKYEGTLPKGTFVDCHSGKVKQKVGSQVQMRRELVDPSRRTECSAGLHVARRQYLRGFGGNIITIIKIAPEDVVAVPRGEPDKMRVRAYHIVGEIPPSAHEALRSNSPMTNKSHNAAKLLADVIAGNHIGVTEIVEIGSAMGGNVTITPVEGAAPAPAKFQNGKVKALEDEKPAMEALTPKAIRAQAVKAKAKKPTKKELAAKKKAKAEKDAARKREKRAAEKAAKAAPVKVAAKKVSKPKDLMAKTNPVVKKPKASAAPAVVAKQRPEKHVKALEMIAAGVGRREIERQLKICRKTLKKLADGTI